MSASEASKATTNRCHSITVNVLHSVCSFTFSLGQGSFSVLDVKHPPHAKFDPIAGQLVSLEDQVSK